MSIGIVTAKAMETHATTSKPISACSGETERSRAESDAPAAADRCCIDDCSDMKRARSNGRGTRVVSVEYATLRTPFAKKKPTNTAYMLPKKCVRHGSRVALTKPM